MPGEIEIEEWKCLAELIDNAFDDFNKIMIFIILEAAVGRVPSVGAAVVSRTAQPCSETAPLPRCHIS